VPLLRRPSGKPGQEGAAAQEEKRKRARNWELRRDSTVGKWMCSTLCLCGSHEERYILPARFKGARRRRRRGQPPLTHQHRPTRQNN
jgi:hypothetical protein